MLALSKLAPGEGQIGIRDVPEPKPGPGDVLLQVEAGGICGTDMQIAKWAPRMARRLVPPRVLGHEASGTVIEVGANVSRVKVGDRISLESHIFCGRCHQCRTGRAHLCIDTRYPGIDIDGAFARYVAVPETIAWVHPQEIPFRIAAMFEPFGIAVHACTLGRGVKGLPVLVNGCGPIGLMGVATAKALGAECVMAVDPVARRRAMAEQLGADAVFDPTTHDVVEEVKARTDGNGAEVAIEFSGTEAGFRTSLAALTKGCDYRLAAAPAFPIEMDFTRWLLQCPVIHTIHGRRIWENWDTLWELYRSGRVDLEPIASHVLPLSEGARAFDLIRSGEALKPILIPD